MSHLVISVDGLNDVRTFNCLCVCSKNRSIFETEFPVLKYSSKDDVNTKRLDYSVCLIAKNEVTVVLCIIV
jgi:hypothetical protein